MLHTVSQSPYQVDIESLLRIVTVTDAILLLQDGVNAALRNSYYSRKLLAGPAPVYVLQPDVVARGISGQISDKIVMIDYTEFIKLTVQHVQQMAWTC